MRANVYAAAFRVRPDRLPYSTHVDAKQIYPSSELLTSLTGQAVQVNKAVVGRNAFSHEAGIHQDGVLKDRRTYEIIRAEDVGAPWNPLVLGKHSGRHAVQRRSATAANHQRHSDNETRRRPLRHTTGLANTPAPNAARRR